MHGLNHAVVQQLTFLPSNSGGEVFLCPQPVKKSKSLKVIKSMPLQTLRLDDIMTFDAPNS
jgi:hypothetical protein